MVETVQVTKELPVSLYNFIFTPLVSLVKSQCENEPDQYSNATMCHFCPDPEQNC